MKSSEVHKAHKAQADSSVRIFSSLVMPFVETGNHPRAMKYFKLAQDAQLASDNMQKRYERALANEEKQTNKPELMECQTKNCHGKQELLNVVTGHGNICDACEQFLYQEMYID